MADITLVFPGVTEARLFPYLSLPQLAGFLRESGFDVDMFDANLALFYQSIDRLMQLNDQDLLPAPLSELQLHQRQWIFSNFTNIMDRVHDHGNEFPMKVAQRIMRSFFDGNLQQCIFGRVPKNWSDVSADIESSKSEWFAQLHTQSIVDRIMENESRAIGFTIAYFSQIVPTLSAVKAIRSIDSSIHIILGGPQIDLWEKELFEATSDDEVTLCKGPGEMVLKQLLSTRGAPKGTHVEQAEFDFRDSAIPDFDGLPFYDYLIDAPQLPLTSCVGCYWGKCAFCSYGNKSLGSYQQLTVTQLADRCARCIDKTGITRLTFVDENSNLSLILRSAEVLKRRGYDFTWSSRNRLERRLASKDFCSRLAKSGCILMSVGYETNSNRLLSKMDKGMDSGHFQQAIDNLHCVGIDLRLSVLGGIFDETSEEANESAKFLEKNAQKIGIDVAQMMIVEPLSRIAQDPDRYEVKLISRKSELARNTEFSYLGGRAGYSYQLLESNNLEREASLRQLVHAVHPSKNDELRPLFRNTLGTLARVVTPVAWVMWEQTSESLKLVDLQWGMKYVLKTNGISVDGSVWSSTDPNGSIHLGRLVELGACIAAEGSDK